MKRRHIAGLLVFVPILVVTVLNIYYPISYEMLTGYMFAVALMFKTALLSFYFASKLKIIIFLKSLTIVQGTLLLVKRWFLDNVFSKWLKKNILDHIKHGFIDMGHYYKVLNIKSKIKNIFIPILLSLGSAWAIYTMGYLDNILIFTEFKMLIIGVSKTVLLMGTKIFGLVINSWITPILEVFALSFIFDKLEKLLGKENPIIKFINFLGEKLNGIIFFFSGLNKKHIDPLLNDRVSKHSKNISQKISEYIKNKRIKHEYEQFDRLENLILKGHIDAYYSFKGMKDIKDKQKLYSLINEKTDDNLEIVAYLSRDKNGNLLDSSVDDSFYHDIFILEGIASSSEYGIKIQDDKNPDFSDYWVLNTSKYPVTLSSHSNDTESTVIDGNSVILIKTKNPQEVLTDDIYFSYKDQVKQATPIIKIKKA